MKTLHISIEVSLEVYEIQQQENQEILPTLCPSFNAPKYFVVGLTRVLNSPALIILLG